MRAGRRGALAGLALAAATLIGVTGTADAAGKKVMLIDSYHQGYEWSDGIEAGVKSVAGAKGLELKVVHMDTKRNPGDAFAKAAGLKAKEAVDAYKPDVLIACDDNASKFVVEPFYKNAALPVVFCGVNWDGSGYGYPYKNATGMVEVALIPQLIENLKGFAKGSRVGFLTADTETERKEGVWIKKLFKVDFAAEEYVKTMAAWKDAFKKLQSQADMLILNSAAGIADWNEAEAAAFALEHGKIPSGTAYAWLMPVSMVGLIKVAEEQGEWSAATAVKIMEGASPASIPVTQNKKASVSLNAKLGAKAGIVFPPALLRNATVLK
jgi:ABC-type uncharacterized transport system substrate-binding protein